MLLLNSSLKKWFSPGSQNRRRFLEVSTAALVVSPAAEAADNEPNMLGPLPGYSPQIGSLVSELTWMRTKALSYVKGLNQEQLDFLLDQKANRIGALLHHLAATETLYQINTFDQVDVQEIQKSPAFKDWAVAMDLGVPARAALKGRNLDYYLTLLQEVREKSLREFRKRDDSWLLAADTKWPGGRTNNLCKWFHVCEHESHHTGQVALIRSRGPGGATRKGE